MQFDGDSSGAGPAKIIPVPLHSYWVGLRRLFMGLCSKSIQRSVWGKKNSWFLAQPVPQPDSSLVWFTTKEQRDWCYHKRGIDGGWD